MRGWIHFFLIAVLAGCANFSAATAPAGKFRVSGRVVNALNGQAIPGAEISIGVADRFDATMQKILTGNDGEFAFTVNETGKYMLVGETNGFRRQSYEQHGAYNSAVVVGPHVSSENIIFRLRPDGRILGTIVDEQQEAVAGAMIYLFRTDASGAGLRETYQASQAVADDRGCYRFAHLEPGRYYVVVAAHPWYAGVLAGAEASGSKATPDVTYPTTFYPGVADVGSASPILVTDGEDATADFRLSEVPAVRLRLSHFNKDPQKPRNASLEQRFFGATINEMGEREISVDDSLEIRGVPAGRYVLEIESYDGSRTKRAMVVNVAGDMELDPDRAAVVPAITGVVKMGGGRDLQQQAFVQLWNVRTNEVLNSMISDKGEIGFEADYLTPGTYSVAAVVNGFNSTIAKLSATGALVKGRSIQITGGKPVQVEIELSRTLSKINGIARKDGKAFPGAMILLVPENPEVNLSLFRRDQSDSDGTYTLRDVLPGRYKMLAIENAWDMEWANLAVLKPRLEKAQTIEVAPDKTYDSVLDVQ